MSGKPDQKNKKERDRITEKFNAEYQNNLAESEKTAAGKRKKKRLKLQNKRENKNFSMYRWVRCER